MNAKYCIACAGFKVGFKPAGGIRQAKDALAWLSLMKEELGDDWTFPNLFRLGASALLVDIERQLFHFVTGRYASLHEFPCLSRMYALELAFSRILSSVLAGILCSAIAVTPCVCAR